METMGDRIRQVRTEKKLTQEQLAALSGVTKGSVSQWENDTTNEIKGGNLYRLCGALGVNQKWLLDGKGSKYPQNDTQLSQGAIPTVNVPLISWMEAGTLWEIPDGWKPRETVGEDVPVPVPSKTVFALRVRDNSMNREVKQGDEIIVDYRDRDLVDGKYYVIADADGDATFRRYRSAPDRYEPASTEDHETIFPEPGLRVIGRVIKKTGDM